MENYEIEVWYRYVYNGEQEKDFDTHKIVAKSAQEAVNIANDKYRSLNAIPFQFLHKSIKYKPQRLTKQEIFTLTTPTIC